MKDELRATLRDYETQCRAEWSLNVKKACAKESLDKLVSTEQAEFTMAVTGIMQDAMPHWCVVSTRCYVMVDHSKKPMDCHINASVELLYSNGKRRGEIRLHGNHDEGQSLLDELRDLVCDREGYPGIICDLESARSCLCRAIEITAGTIDPDTRESWKHAAGWIESTEKEATK